MPKGTNFSVWPFRFHFRAVDPLYFPEDKASNVIRGAFGGIFRKLACIPSCEGVGTCEIASDCPYALIFEPRQELSFRGGPSGLSDWPRPFVFRALHLDGRRLVGGEEFYFDLILFEAPEKPLPYFVLAFRELGRCGLGPGRGRAELQSVEDLASGLTLYADQHFTPEVRPQGIHLDFVEAVSAAADRVVVRFETPTELKAEGGVVEKPEFAVLVARLRDRISNLRLCYQGGGLEIDFEAIGKAASAVAIVRSSLRRVEVSRQSSRTGQRHSIGGVVGEIEYRGDLGALVPFLRAGEWTGVGRQTVWGKGMLGVSLRRAVEAEE